MKPVFAAGLLVLLACIGAACARTAAQWLSFVILLVIGFALGGRACRWPRRAMASLALILCLVCVRCAAGAVPQPQPDDPSLLLPADQAVTPVQLVGRVRADAAVRSGRCRTLLDVSSLNGRISRGRTELTLEPCRTPLQTGTWIEAEGIMRRPQSAPHPALPGDDLRLALKGSWSRLSADAIRVLRQDRGKVVCWRLLCWAELRCPFRKACAMDSGWQVSPMPWRPPVFICPCCWAAH